MKYVIWGAGERGARVYPHLEESEIKAFIDIDENKVGKEYCGKRIIDFKEYKEKYSDCYIIISYMHEDEVIAVLEREGIYKYFLLTECPAEFQESYPRDILKRYIIRNIKRDKKYIIYGCTLYSLILCKWVKSELGIILNIIPHRTISSRLLKQLKLESTEIHFGTLDDLRCEDIDEVLVTIEQDVEFIYQRGHEKLIVNNVYDCSDRIEEYYNPQIERFKNIHNGQRCFIVATGPSLKMEDLDILAKHDEICISVNSISKAFPYTIWKPHYYIAVDYRTLRDWGDVMENADIPYLFWGDTYKDYWMKDHAEKHIQYHLVYEYSEKRYPKFSEDFARKSYLGSTIVYNAIQLAVYMGFKKIYLLGVDFSYAGKKENAKYDHFYKEETLTAIGYSQQVYLSYLSAQKYAEENEIKIYNATRGGKLEVFERVDFDKLFE